MKICERKTGNGPSGGRELFRLPVFAGAASAESGAMLFIKIMLAD
jgi:hypothetical protein